MPSILKAGTAQLDAWANAFYNDAYWFGQMACSSPRLVLWLGGTTDDVSAARLNFWSALDARVSCATTTLEIADYINKRVAVDSLAVEFLVKIPTMINNETTRVWLDQPALHNDFHCGAGLFFESGIPCVTDLLPLLSRKIQTVSYMGVDVLPFTSF